MATTINPKAKRRTRERIAETALELCNRLGEPSVTTSAIADEMNISPGNLYYHFRSKNQIVAEIFGAFERDIDAVLVVPAGRHPDVEDAWLFLHLLFELVWRYRFLFRDLNDLLARNRPVALRFRRILERAERITKQLCEGMVATGQMRADRHEIAALASNMVLVSTYWLSYAGVRDPRQTDQGRVLGQGVYQVMSMLAPSFVGEARRLFASLAAQYVAK
jgi:AcrR family transcriptional regulator